MCARTAPVPSCFPRADPTCEEIPCGRRVSEKLFLVDDGKHLTGIDDSEILSSIRVDGQSAQNEEPPSRVKLSSQTSERRSQGRERECVPSDVPQRFIETCIWISTNLWEKVTFRDF